MRSRVRKSPLRSLLGGAVALAALSFLPDASAQRPGRGASPGLKALPRAGTSGSNPIEYTYSGTGGPNGVARGSIHITGTSTFKWRWVPPNKPGTSDPDLDDFPVPPLFVLGVVQARVSAQPEDPGNLSGLSGSGQVSDGFGDGWAPHFEGIPGAAPATTAEALRRGIVPAAPEGPTTVTAGLSPSVTLDVSGVRGGADPVTGYPKPGGNAHDTALHYHMQTIETVTVFPMLGSCLTTLTQIKQILQVITVVVMLGTQRSALT